MTNLTAHEKSRISLRYWLLGRRFFQAAKALGEAEGFHLGTRKDGVTPEFAHQIAIANHLRTLALEDSDLEVILTACFFHDTPEDKDYPVEAIALKYGARVGEVVRRMTKEFLGVKVPPETYFTELSQDPLAAILKGGDRVHNIGSMVGVFSIEKQKEYITETEQYHLPMLKLASRNFPEYEAVLMNLRQTLMSQIALIKQIHKAGAKLD